MATYRSDGTLIKDQDLEYSYNEIYIYLPEGYRPSGSTETTPLMQIDSITDITVNNSGISYIIHTDGYYKSTSNFIGSVGITKENWTDDITKTVNFYNNSKLVSELGQNPF